ncbi:RNA polymerase sigma-70 ECF-like, Rhodopirellula baltica [Rhodopirellula maiorica SM1]|uniref:RNA polymerase sigma-70 ECF-like, Rhodopirellula baltica n=1 Tax=Rhodopirellula maiorica SM1 TaxID=1265738 RepID=M5RS25_9BACT|nr:sigma-70 family RNA polymerase sigma factor [Rhodopirellula maiorica]EMI22095.1 RNA polymerase sigma-70 ECF-like, Rhodopirellula baltica [Rhodopirellula maiorica SM1]
MADVNNESGLSDEQFVDRLTSSQRQLRCFILGLVARPSDADDLLQEVNLALWRKRMKYDASQNFLQWAFGFASMEVKSFHSRNAKSKVVLGNSAIELLTDEWEQSENYLDECRDSLSRCLQKLETEDRKVIEGYYRHRQSIERLAGEINRPASTVYKMLYRARDTLRRCVKFSQLENG